MVAEERQAFAARLNEALDDAQVVSGWGRRAAVARMFGVSGEAARKWLEGEARPSNSRIPLIAQRLDVHGEWLLTGQGPKRSRYPASVPGAQPPGVVRVPVISYIQAGAPREVVDAYAEGGGFASLGVVPELANRLGPHAFALQVEGESMLPDFRPGDYVVVDPNAVVRPGDAVIAKLDREEAATLKKYRSRGVDANGVPVFELVPLNDDYPTVVVDASNPGHLIGRVVEHRRLL